MRDREKIWNDHLNGVNVTAEILLDIRDQLKPPVMPVPVPGGELCVVCGSEPVDSASGYDTCSTCAERI